MLLMMACAVSEGGSGQFVGAGQGRSVVNQPVLAGSVLILFAGLRPLSCACYFSKPKHDEVEQRSGLTWNHFGGNNHFKWVLSTTARL